MSQTNIYDVKNIREACVEEHEQLLEMAVVKLTAKGCIVHVAKDEQEAKNLISELCKEDH